MILKKLLLLFLSATLTLGFTACSDDDDDYPTLAQRNADKIRSLGIKTANVYFGAGEEVHRERYNVSIDGDYLVLTSTDTSTWETTYYVPLDSIRAIVKDDGYYGIFL